MSQQFDVKSAVPEYVAGELSASEVLLFEAALAENPQLAQEVAFWQSVHADMHDMGTAAPPTVSAAHITNVVKHRLVARQGDAHRRLRRLAYSGWAVAAAASLLVIILGGRELLRPQPFTDGTFANGKTIAFLEDGTAINLPARGMIVGPNQAPLYGDDFMPARLPVVYENAHDVPAATPLPVVNTSVARPCIGVIVQPVALNQAENKTGLLIVRVMGNSPASQIGIQPGDVLLTINGTALYTRYCIAHAIRNLPVGSPVTLAVYRPSEEREFTANTKLGVYFD